MGCREQIYRHQGKRGKWDELGDWDGHTCTTVHKTDN